MTVHTAFEKAGPSFFAEFFSRIQNLQFLISFFFSSSAYFHQRTGDRQNAASRIKEERKVKVKTLKKISYKFFSFCGEIKSVSREVFAFLRFSHSIVIWDERTSEKRKFLCWKQFFNDSLKNWSFIKMINAFVSKFRRTLNWSQTGKLKQKKKDNWKLFENVEIFETTKAWLIIQQWQFFNKTIFTSLGCAQPVFNKKLIFNENRGKSKAKAASNYCHYVTKHPEVPSSWSGAFGSCLSGFQSFVRTDRIVSECFKSGNCQHFGFFIW